MNLPLGGTDAARNVVPTGRFTAISSVDVSRCYSAIIDNCLALNVVRYVEHFPALYTPTPAPFRLTIIKSLDSVFGVLEGYENCIYPSSKVQRNYAERISI